MMGIGYHQRLVNYHMSTIFINSLWQKYERNRRDKMKEAGRTVIEFL